MTKATVSAIHSGEKQCIKVVKFDAFIEFRFVTCEVTTVATDHSGVRTVCKSGEIFLTPTVLCSSENVETIQYRQGSEHIHLVSQNGGKFIGFYRIYKMLWYLPSYLPVCSNYL